VDLGVGGSSPLGCTNVLDDTYERAAAEGWEKSGLALDRSGWSRGKTPCASAPRDRVASKEYG
jgi:hypothetical protein